MGCALQRHQAKVEGQCFKSQGGPQSLSSNCFSLPFLINDGSALYSTF